jgi:hypothetical protein
MARLTDPRLLARYKQALAEWKVAGYVELTDRAHEGLRTTLEGVTVKYFKEVLFTYVCTEDGEVDQVKEEREPWRDHWDFHYDLRPTINGVKLYIETRLHPEALSSREEPTILIVQIKPA